MLEYLKSGFTWVIAWLKALALTLLIPVLEEIGEQIPDDWNSGIESFLQWISYLDSWLPLSFGIRLLLAFYGIKATLNAIKWLLKSVPGIWG